MPDRRDRRRADHVRLGASDRPRSRPPARGDREALHGRRSVRTTGRVAEGNLSPGGIPPSGLALAPWWTRAANRRSGSRRTRGPTPLARLRAGGTRFVDRVQSRRAASVVGRRARGGYPVLHWMDLGHRSGFTDVWRGPRHGRPGSPVRPVRVVKSVNAGTMCDDRQALVIGRSGDARDAVRAGPGSARLARPDPPAG
jgi:hypothetical protein